MKKFTATSLAICIALSSTPINANALDINTIVNAFTGKSTSSTTSTGTVNPISGENTANSNTAAKNSTIGANSSSGAINSFTNQPNITTNKEELSDKIADASLATETSAEDAAVQCATSPTGLGAVMAKTQAAQIQEIASQPTISTMVNAAKENKNALSVGCFTASTEVVNLSNLVPDLKSGLGSAIGKIVQQQINTMIQKTKDTLMQQVCDVGNEMIAKAMNPINEQLKKANGTIMGLSLESLVGSKIAEQLGGNDEFSKIVRDSIGEVVSQTDATLKANRDEYAASIGYGNGESYDPFAGLKATANQMYNDADKIAQNAVNNTQASVNTAISGSTGSTSTGSHWIGAEQNSQSTMSTATTPTNTPPKPTNPSPATPIVSYELPQNTGSKNPFER